MRRKQNLKTPKLLSCGVPQRKILALLLFLLYINDLMTFSQTRMYADDTSLTFASTDVNHLNNCLNYDLSKVYTWLSANKLTLNLTKREFMLIASRQKLSNISERPSLAINDMAVEQVASAKSLESLHRPNFKLGMSYWKYLQKIASAIGAIKRIRHLMPFNILIIVYHSLVQPRFDYRNVVWGNCNKGLSDKLQKLQNRAAPAHFDVRWI